MKRKQHIVTTATGKIFKCKDDATTLHSTVWDKIKIEPKYFPVKWISCNPQDDPKTLFFSSAWEYITEQQYNDILKTIKFDKNMKDLLK